jgi:hypothetical protein
MFELGQKKGCAHCGQGHFIIADTFKARIAAAEKDEIFMA